MGRIARILVTRCLGIAVLRPLPLLAALALSAGLSACGQQGALYLPTEPAAARRATLPETLIPSPAAPRPAAPASQ